MKIEIAGKKISFCRKLASEFSGENRGDMIGTARSDLIVGQRFFTSGPSLTPGMDERQILTSIVTAIKEMETEGHYQAVTESGSLYEIKVIKES